MKFILIQIVMIYILSSIGHAQMDDSYKSFVELAKQQFEQKNYDEARKTIKLALKKNEAGSEANKVLGDIYFEEKKWKAAEKAYKKTFFNKPDNLYAHFRIAISKRERGRFQNLVSQRFTFNSAAEHFKKVIHDDPFYEMVYAEFARLEFYRENFREAIDLCLTGLKLQPRDNKSRQDIYRYYDYYLELGERNTLNPLDNPDQKQLEWLRSRNSPFDHFMVGEKYRRMGLFAKADSILSNLINNPLDISKIPIYLARVRLYYQMGRDAEAEQDYWAALDKVRSYFEFQFFFEEIKFMMSDSDLKVRLPNMIAIRQFYKRFWSSHNIFPGSRVNLRLAEHYRRLIFAEQNYRFYGDRLDVNTPEYGRILDFPDIFYKNQKFNDKGLVYLRYGHPDEIAVSPSAGSLSNESWLYRETASNPKLIFHFEIGRDAKPTDWRLVALPSDPSMVESRLGWDNLLDTYYTAATQMDQISAIAQIQVDSKNKVLQAMDRQRPFSMSQVEPMYLSVDPVQFWDELGNPYLDINIGIPMDQLSPLVNHSYETGFATLDTMGNILEKRSLEINDSLNPENTFFTKTFKAFPNQNTVIIAAHVREPDSNRIGGIKFKKSLRHQNSGGPEISDILLATRIVPAQGALEHTHQGLDIHPNPSGRFDKNEPLFLYYEIYNLKPDNGLRRYKIERSVEHIQQGKSLFGRIYSALFRRSPQRQSISRESQSIEKIAIEYSGIDLSKWATGPVKITIKLTDLVDGKRAEISKQLFLE